MFPVKHRIDAVRVLYCGPTFRDGYRREIRTRVIDAGRRREFNQAPGPPGGQKSDRHNLNDDPDQNPCPQW